MNTVEDVEIPLLILPPPKDMKLVRWIAADGSSVNMGDVIFELQIDDVVYEVESFYTGFIKFVAPNGSIHQVGDVVAHMYVDENLAPPRTIPVALTSRELAILDAQRGELTRSLYIRQLVCDTISDQ